MTCLLTQVSRKRMKKKMKERKQKAREEKKTVSLADFIYSGIREGKWSEILLIFSSKLQLQLLYRKCS